MRLDKYLKCSRLIKRRSAAKEACDAGRVLLNGRVAKAGSEVAPGDIIEIAFGNRKIRVQVVEIREHVSKEEARNMYKEID